MSDNKEFKEIKDPGEIMETLDEMKKSWDGICEAFEVDPEKPVASGVLRSSIKLMLMDLDELSRLDYVKNSGKKLEPLADNYVNALQRFIFCMVDGEDAAAWREVAQDYAAEIFTSDVCEKTYNPKEDEARSLDSLIDDTQRLLSIANQLNVIKGAESGDFKPDSFVGLINNFSYIGIGLVQRCHGNAVVMGQVVTFLKVLIKTNDIILKQISELVLRMK